MGYADYSYYKSLYGDAAASDCEFNNYLWDSMRLIDAATTGVDGYAKLRLWFPDDDYNIEAVRRCVCKLVHTMHLVNDAETAITQNTGYIPSDTGVHSKIVTSVSAGNESISYASAKSDDTTISAAASDIKYRYNLYNSIIVDGLAGITDKNGVNLLYMGRYPTGHVNVY